MTFGETATHRILTPFGLRELDNLRSCTDILHFQARLLAKNQLDAIVRAVRTGKPRFVHPSGCTRRGGSGPDTDKHARSQHAIAMLELFDRNVCAVIAEAAPSGGRGLPRVPESSDGLKGMALACGSVLALQSFSSRSRCGRGT